MPPSTGTKLGKCKNRCGYVRLGLYSICWHPNRNNVIKHAWHLFKSLKSEKLLSFYPNKHRPVYFSTTIYPKHYGKTEVSDPFIEEFSQRVHSNTFLKFHWAHFSLAPAVMKPFILSLMHNPLNCSKPPRPTSFQDERTFNQCSKGMKSVLINAHWSLWHHISRNWCLAGI